MISTFVIAVALAVGADGPVPAAPWASANDAAEVFTVPGPYFKIPCTVLQPNEVELVQVYVSENRGKKWALAEEFAPDKGSFTFGAKRPGEYWFAVRLKNKAGTFHPADITDPAPDLRVRVATGSTDPLVPAKPSVTDSVKELDDELTRVELELIRKELKSLAEAKELTPKTEAKIDRLRARLQQARERLGGDPSARPNALRYEPPVLLPPEVQRAPAPDGDLIPPQIVPVTPVPAPARPVAPPPRARERP